IDIAVQLQRFQYSFVLQYTIDAEPDLFAATLEKDRVGYRLNAVIFHAQFIFGLEFGGNGHAEVGNAAIEEKFFVLSACGSFDSEGRRGGQSRGVVMVF